MLPKSALNNEEAKKELDKIFEKEKTIYREKLTCKAWEYTYNFRNFRTIRTFGRNIYEVKITAEEADEDQSNLLIEIRNFHHKTRPRNDKKKQEKKVVLENLYKLFEARERFTYGFECKIFPITSNGSGLSNTD